MAEGDEDIADWIRRQMARRDWRSADLARRLGVNTGRVSRWITGKDRPSSSSCLRLADVFGVDPDEVLARAGHRVSTEPLPADDPKRRIISLVKRVKMTATEAAGLEAMLRAWLEREGNGPENAS